MIHSTINWRTAPGHQVLAAAGKTILRPGGRAATEQLLAWADFQPGETVLELASSFGYSAIALAQQFGVRVVGVEANAASVAQARINVANAGLSDHIEIIEGNIFNLDQIQEQFDYVLAEAILTMQSAPGKEKLLSLIGDRLKPGGTFLSHELVTYGHQADVHRALSEAIRVNATPLSESGWIDACQRAGLSVNQHHTGDMRLLDPRQMLDDEGPVRVLKIFWSVLTRPNIRQRIFGMRRAFQTHRDHLGYIILCAQKH
ncbi:MAG: SAM-dependent methyltransferase [Elainellaceae cyanobacterium]